MYLERERGPMLELDNKRRLEHLKSKYGGIIHETHPFQKGKETTRKNITNKKKLFVYYHMLCDDLSSNYKKYELKGMASELNIPIPKKATKMDLCSTIGAHLMLSMKYNTPLIR